MKTQWGNDPACQPRQKRKEKEKRGPTIHAREWALFDLKTKRHALIVLCTSRTTLKTNHTNIEFDLDHDLLLSLRSQLGCLAIHVAFRRLLRRGRAFAGNHCLAFRSPSRNFTLTTSPRIALSTSSAARVGRTSSSTVDESS